MSFVRFVNLRVPAGAARPGPAIGQALGPLGINMAEFCKRFNEESDKLGYEKDTLLRVQLSANSDRSFAVSKTLHVLPSGHHLFAARDLDIVSSILGISSLSGVVSPAR